MYLKLQKKSYLDIFYVSLIILRYIKKLNDLFICNVLRKCDIQKNIFDLLSSKKKKKLIELYLRISQCERFFFEIRNSGRVKYTRKTNYSTQQKMFGKFHLIQQRFLQKSKVTVSISITLVESHGSVLKKSVKLSFETILVSTQLPLLKIVFMNNMKQKFCNSSIDEQ